MTADRRHDPEWVAQQAARRESLRDPRFVAPQHRDVPAAKELYAAGSRRDARQQAENRRHDRDEEIDLVGAAADFLAQMKANATKTPQDRARERLAELRRDLRR